MYNLLVTSHEGAWDEDSYEFDRSRFLEYTNDQLFESFKELTTNNISQLKAIPCIFAYEGNSYNIKIGYLTSIETHGRGRIIRIKYRFIDTPKIPFASIEPIASSLDIREWEMNRTHWAIKSEALFEHLSTIVTIPEELLEDSNETIKLVKNKSNESKVKSVRGFIEKVLSSNGGAGNEIFYRGHSDSSYKLVPTLFRTDTEGNPLYQDKEDILYRELIISNSHDFANDEATLDRLIRMQHYSLPTRLLDITSNPLIALYFACNTNNKKKGEVISFSLQRDSIKYFDSNEVSYIANLARLNSSERKDVSISIVYSSLGGRFYDLPAVGKLHRLIMEEKPFYKGKINPADLKKIVCLKGKKSNDRISAQSGAFLLFGLDVFLSEDGDDDIKVNRIIVEDKKKILKELDLLNINESTVFPYIESSAKYIRNKYSFNKT